ncbi:MAG: hypothetical protein ABI333_15525 [bacterium]
MMRMRPHRHRRLPRHCLRFAALSVLLAITTACLDDMREASELIDAGQVIGVRATPPEVNPGDRVTLDALVHWPSGEPTLVWLVCVPDVGDTLMSCLSNQLGQSLEPPLCDLDPSARLCLAGMNDTVNYRVPEGIFPDDGEDHTFFVNLLATDGGDIASCSDTLMGGAPTDTCLLSIKRVVVSYKDPAELNVNPIASRFTLQGRDLDPDAVETVDSTEPDIEDFELRVGFIVDAASVDELFPPDEEPTSYELVVSWFADCGAVEKEKSFVYCSPLEDTGEPFCEPAVVTWTPKTTGECTFHAVVRDLRGGVGFVSQRFLVQSL